MYKSVVRPSTLYGAETWAVKKDQEKTLEVAEMKMLRWMCGLCGVTRLDRIRNKVIRRKVRVVEISKKMQERRLQWFGHVEREERSGSRAMGRPKKTWRNCVIEDMREKGVTAAEAQDEPLGLGRDRLKTSTLLEREKTE
ncbi:hypothetical protein M8J77_014281 [Diaphorina citri]|nr:hypothetical protein M8J77_014281 [Diaphorina citri]